MWLLPLQCICNAETARLDEEVGLEMPAERSKQSQTAECMRQLPLQCSPADERVRAARKAARRSLQKQLMCRWDTFSKLIARFDEQSLQSNTNMGGSFPKFASLMRRWDTFGKLIPNEQTPDSETKFRGRYTKAPSFLTFHFGVKADMLPEGCHCHHIIVEDWKKMEEPRGTLFVSIPTLLDPSLSPDGTSICTFKSSSCPSCKL